MRASADILVQFPGDGVGLGAARRAPLSDCLKAAGILLNYPCGGNGRCGACRVLFVSGAPAPAGTEIELLDEGDLSKGVRLACRCRLDADATVEIPKASRVVEPRILVASESVRFALAPSVVKRVVQPEPSTLQHPLSDIERVEAVVLREDGQALDPTAAFMRKLPAALRTCDGLATITVRGNLLLDAEPGDSSERVFGMAVDLGTTTIAASLHSLRTGEPLGLAATLNPQALLGEDVISRIGRTFRNPDGLAELQSVVAAAIGGMARRLCASADVAVESVYEIVVAGNAAMNHLLLGVPPESLALAPYAPVFRVAPEVAAREVGIAVNAEARLVALPNIGGFVGGDTVAGLLVADLVHVGEPSLLIDIGTNCEVVLACGGRLLAASAPAGPAMEGACIDFGMRAEPGAIDDVAIVDGSIRIHTIDGEPARGLCGSGLVHAVAALRACGALGANGLLVQGGPLAGRFESRGPGCARFLLAGRSEGSRRDVWLTQRDVREFQLARAAITSAWKTLCGIAGIEEDSVRRVLVAGAFGNYMRPEAMLSLGLTPSQPGVEIRFVGNSSLEGARMALLDRDARSLAMRLPSMVEFVELAGREGFDETFALELALGQ